MNSENKKKEENEQKLTKNRKRECNKIKKERSKNEQ